jgi:hypothetical protein
MSGTKMKKSTPSCSNNLVSTPRTENREHHFERKTIDEHIHRVYHTLAQHT